METSRRSPVVRLAYGFLARQAGVIADPALKKETLDAISNPGTCIRHRAALSDAGKKKIVEKLIAERLADPAQDETFPGGILAGVFPPVLGDGSACPRLPQRFSSAPGGSFSGHHSYPGGLAIHEAVNERASMDLARNYRKTYGRRAGMAPSRKLPRRHVEKQTDKQLGYAADIFIDQDIMIAAPIWHDWAKTIVFQWNEDGTELPELSLGGTGATDNYGSSGDSRTGAHHILGIAEAMKRGLSPALVITQASAHAAPTPGNEFKVVNWLRAAAIVAKIDPVKKGYLAADEHGRLHLPALRSLGNIDLEKASPAQTNLLAEYALHNLSDADFTYTGAAAASANLILQRLAPGFGFDPADMARYNNNFRNPALSFLTAERIFILYSEKGLAGVKAELQRLRQEKVFQ